MAVAVRHELARSRCKIGAAVLLMLGAALTPYLFARDDVSHFCPCPSLFPVADLALAGRGCFSKVVLNQIVFTES
jgi:hypothetical protein